MSASNQHPSKKVIAVCKEKLLAKKSDLLNRIVSTHAEYKSRDRGGDETDLAVDALAEGEFLQSQERFRNLLLDIEWALAKIETGSYGICEETEEPIEPDRLLAIPWTRLSIEGAEIREALSKRYAKS